MPRVSIWDIISLSFGLKGNLEKEELVSVDEEKVITKREFSIVPLQTHCFPAILFLGGSAFFFSRVE